jgi:hypothetical protein
MTTQTETEDQVPGLVAELEALKAKLSDKTKEAETLAASVTKETARAEAELQIHKKIKVELAESENRANGYLAKGKK